MELDPGHAQKRTILRIVGVLFLIPGAVLMITGMVSIFSSFDSHEPPRYLWCCFAGMPLLFVGFVATMNGFMGAMSRYSAGEMAPVGKDAFNYMAEECDEGIAAATAAVGKGLRAASRDEADQVRCAVCGHENVPKARFCQECGTALQKPCPACHGLNEPDAKFCISCGGSLA